MYRTGNPALNDNVFKNTIPASAGSMTIQGTVNKSFILFMITLIGAAWIWGKPAQYMGFAVPAAIIGFIIALITIFKKEWAPVTAPLYAAAEGVFLGGISSIFEAAYPGIVIQAVALTFGTFFCLLAAYRSGLIKPTENFKLGIVAATGGIAVVYLISWVMGFFGHGFTMIYSSGPAGIIFSLVVVVVAALNLVLDFDFIEKGADAGVPIYMEWYAAFGLMVTLIWLYLEMLRLIGKVRSR
ncbi:MAG: Bax inhibitor-1/YccA family protein [Candidatus Omnitrophica bacterium]|nr:Bax inhibitor-1/YccA family protein [Candidatus Omnitrophota bacterium]MDD5488739.1 Bax inhibitor-1/YccA family protein [Candidatus Omnitrophota bacterium]